MNSARPRDPSKRIFGQMPKIDHPELGIRVKESPETESLWRETKALAEPQGKTPVLIVPANVHGKEGELLVIHSSDFESVVLEGVIARRDDLMRKIAAQAKAAAAKARKRKRLGY